MSRDVTQSMLCGPAGDVGQYKEQHATLMHCISQPSWACGRSAPKPWPSATSSARQTGITWRERHLHSNKSQQYLKPSSLHCCSSVAACWYALPSYKLALSMPLKRACSVICMKPPACIS